MAVNHWNQNQSIVNQIQSNLVLENAQLYTKSIPFSWDIYIPLCRKGLKKEFFSVLKAPKIVLEMVSCVFTNYTFKGCVEKFFFIP